MGLYMTRAWLDGPVLFPIWCILDGDHLRDEMDLGWSGCVASGWVVLGSPASTLSWTLGWVDDKRDAATAAE